MAALETQVKDLAGRVRHTEQDAAAARVLAGGADREVGEIRGEIRDFRQATTSSFNAMRADLTDLRQDLTDLRQQMDAGFDRIDGKFSTIDDEFAKVDNSFIGIRGRLDTAAAGQAQIVAMLDTLIGRQDP